MASRHGIVALVQNRDVDRGEPPNAYIQCITAEIRMFWPPLATDQQIEQALTGVLMQARQLIAAKRRRSV